MCNIWYMFIFDQINGLYHQDDALEFARDARGQQLSKTIQIYLNPRGRSLENFLNTNIFSKQIFDLSRRKINFQATNFESDRSSKKVFLVFLSEQNKKNPTFNHLDLPNKPDFALNLVEEGTINYNFVYGTKYPGVSNLCPLRA